MPAGQGNVPAGPDHRVERQRQTAPPPQPGEPVEPADVVEMAVRPDLFNRAAPRLE
jgi:hypothetical protein